MKERWKMSRIGFVNFWLYDEEDFAFNDGKLLLRGQNGSGKSITTQSFIPFVLDGAVRRAGWIHLVRVIEKWNIIFWEKKEKMSQPVIFFLSLKKKKQENIEPSESDSGPNGESRWISGVL